MRLRAEQRNANFNILFQLLSYSLKSDTRSLIMEPLIIIDTNASAKEKK